MAAKKKGEPGENPLVPNAKLRAMYVAMLQARTLEDAVQKRLRVKGQKRRATSIRGQEAVRVSTVLQLGADDLVSDASESAGMASILDVEPIALLKAYTSSKTAKVTTDKLLPPVPDAEERLRLTLGAAMALKAQSRQGVVIAYIQKDELSASASARILEPAARHDLPIIFVVLPRTTGHKKGDEVASLAKVAGKSGVPGIPVDSCDAVALYRVTQESLGRTRAGDGPVLIECISWRLPGSRVQAESNDPIEHLRLFLLGKRISTASWFRQAQVAANRRLKKNQTASNRG